MANGESQRSRSSGEGEARRDSAASARPGRPKIRPDARPYGMQAVDLIAELVDSAERPVTFPASKLPHENARRLLETLGVTIVEDEARNISANKRRPEKTRRRGDELPAAEVVERRVSEALERARARGERSELERAVRSEWAA